MFKPTVIIHVVSQGLLESIFDSHIFIGWSWVSEEIFFVPKYLLKVWILVNDPGYKFWTVESAEYIHFQLYQEVQK